MCKKTLAACILLPLTMVIAGTPDPDVQQFSTVFELSLSQVSSNRIDLASFGLVEGESWCTDTCSNQIISIKRGIPERPMLRQEIRLISVDFTSEASCSAIVEEYATKDIAFNEYLSGFVENTMPIDLITSLYEKQDSMRDLCLVRFPTAERHGECLPESVYIIRSNIVVKVFGSPGANPIQAAATLMGRFYRPVPQRQ